MNLECPGCHARLRLDPAKVSAGAAAAVCPKCKTRIALPGAQASGPQAAGPQSAAAQNITVQCAGCGSRLKVNVDRLKPGVSRSRCPKCNGEVELPSAPPPPEGRGAAPPPMPPSAQTRRLDPREMGMILGEGSPAPGSMPPSAQTRRLDPKEMGVMLAGASQPSPAGKGAPSASAPIALDHPLEHSDVDLGRLIDERVESLGEDSGKNRAVSAPAEAPHAPVEPAAPAAPETPAEVAAPLAPQPGPEPSFSAMRDRGGSRKKAAVSGEDLRPSGGSGSRPSPRFAESIGIRPAEQAPGAAWSCALAGLASGAIVGGASTLLASSVPALWISAAPAVVSSLTGASLARVVLTVLLSGIAGWIGGIAQPPQTDAGGGTAAPSISFFRVTAAGVLVGLIAGIVFTLVDGAFDLVPALNWTRDIFVCGVLTAPIARLLSRR